MIFTLRRQIFVLIAASLGAVLFCVFQIDSAYKEHQRLMESVRVSHQIESIAWRWVSQNPSKEEVRQIRALMETIEPEPRRAAFRRVFQAYDENRSLKGKVDFFHKSEQEFRRYQTGRIEFARQNLLYLFACLSSLVTGALLGVLFFFRRSVLTPIRSLSRKMTDFLHDRYTYQFTVPNHNELGQLQSTFNSLAQRVLRNMEELTTLDHAKSEFLSIASHELRTPLTSIKGSLSLLKSGVVGELNEMATNLLNIAENETDRLIRLINELLDLAKIESGKFEVTPSWQPVDPLVERTFSSLNGLAQAAGVRLKFETLSQVEALMDADRIQQVLTNLLSNAIKFSPQGASVDVVAEIDQAKGLVFSVRDHGKGIAPEDQDLIFQKFRQATSAKTPLVKGTGLGLAIAKALIEEHGGEIGVRSTPGEGSVFYFSLPQWRHSQQLVTESVDDNPGVAA